MSRYPARIEQDSTGFAVSFRDIPEALTCGETLEEAKVEAAGALRTAMEFYFEDRRPVPAPSEPEEGEVLIALPVSVDAKVLLLNAMCTRRISGAELARRMDLRPQEVVRIMDLGHATKIDTVADALAALDIKLSLVAEPVEAQPGTRPAHFQSAEAAAQHLQTIRDALNAIETDMGLKRSAPTVASDTDSTRRRKVSAA